MSITVSNLTKRYGTNEAIRGISFTVNRGEIVGFLGPNGAGKTTTMKIITCFMPPTSGNVEVEGMDTVEHSLDVRRKIGYLPEMNPLYLDMPVTDYLEYSGSLHGLKGASASQRIAKMIDVCGLTTVRYRDIGELSKGFRQRVGLAQAMLHDPEVLILDEPTSGLDPNQIVEIRALIRELGRAKTVVLSTHILSEVQATCDRVLIINEGAIVADGTPDALQRQFQGEERIVVELRVPQQLSFDAVLVRLRSLPDFTAATLLSHADGMLTFDVQAAPRADLREAVFRLAVAEGWVLLGMQRQTTSLEEVFHKLTT
ncbi:MAG: ATP-binding cassette domain-containing protein [Bacteroidota bacterium]